jgi:hypothetical protein
MLDELEAIRRVRIYVDEKYPTYPSGDLTARRFEIGWTVFPKPEQDDFNSIRVGQTVFLIGDSGEIMEASGSVPPSRRVAEFVRRFGGIS